MLFWVPGHASIRSNESASRAAKAGTKRLKLKAACEQLNLVC